MRQEDITQVLEIINADCRNFFDRQQPLPEETLRTRFQNRAESGYRYFVCEDSGRIAGFACAQFGRNTYLSTLGVREGLRGQGIGRRLFERMIEEADRIGCVRIYCEAREDNIPPQFLIISCGFAPEGYFRNQMYDGGATVRYVRFLR